MKSLSGTVRGTSRKSLEINEGDITPTISQPLQDHQIETAVNMFSLLKFPNNLDCML